MCFEQIQERLATQNWTADEDVAIRDYFQQHLFPRAALCWSEDERNAVLDWVLGEFQYKETFTIVTASRSNHGRNHLERMTQARDAISDYHLSYNGKPLPAKKAWRRRISKYRGDVPFNFMAYYRIGIIQRLKTPPAFDVDLGPSLNGNPGNSPDPLPDELSKIWDRYKALSDKDRQICDDKIQHIPRVKTARRLCPESFTNFADDLAGILPQWAAEKGIVSTFADLCQFYHDHNRDHVYERLVQLRAKETKILVKVPRGADAGAIAVLSQTISNAHTKHQTNRLYQRFHRISVHVLQNAPIHLVPFRCSARIPVAGGVEGNEDHG